MTHFKIIREFKIAMINILKAVMETVDSMEEQMHNINRDRKIPSKIQKEMLGIKTR